MTDDKMPPLPAYVYGRETAANERLIPLGDAEAWRNAARAYAAEQVRELVEALQEAECALSLMHSYGHCAPDSYTGARDAAQVRAGHALERVSALIAKHKGTP
jgi:hypothetical protein